MEVTWNWLYTVKGCSSAFIWLVAAFSPRPISTIPKQIPLKGWVQHDTG